MLPEFYTNQLHVTPHTYLKTNSAVDILSYVVAVVLREDRGSINAQHGIL